MNARTSFGYRRFYEDLDALTGTTSEPVVTDEAYNYRFAKTIAGALRKAAEARRSAARTDDPDFRAYYIADAKGWLSTAGMMNDTNRYCDGLALISRDLASIGDAGVTAMREATRETVNG